MSDVIAELIDEPENKPSYTELNNLFNRTKTEGAKPVSELAGDFTLNGMEGVNELVSTAMNEIKTFVDNGKKKSTINKASSKVLAVIDPNNSWAGKWMNNAADKIEEERLKELSINEIVEELCSKIEKERETVLILIDKAQATGVQMAKDAKIYDSIAKQAEVLLESLDDNTRDKLNAQFLFQMSATARDTLYTDMDSNLKPLLAAATISVEKIQSILPTIENDLKYSGGFKVFEQKLSDLNNMTKATLELASGASSIIRDDIRKSTLNALEMVAETGIDTKRLANVQQEEIKHQKDIDAVLTKTKAKIDENFNEVRKISNNLLEHRTQRNETLLENFSK